VKPHLTRTGKDTFEYESRVCF